MKIKMSNFIIDYPEIQFRPVITHFFNSYNSFIFHYSFI